MDYIYKNRFGQLKLEVVGAYQDVTKTRSREFDDDCFFDINIAEKIALITGNNGIQLGFCSPDRKKAYVVHHTSSSVAAVCRIVSLDFDKTIDVRSELDRPNPHRGPLG